MRNSSLLRAATVLAVTSFCGMAQAADDRATMTLNLPALQYGSTNSETKPDGGTSAKAKTDTVTTGDMANSYVSLGFGNYLFYYYFLSDLKAVSIGYMVTPMVEVGVDFGMNTSKTDKPKTEDNSTLIGLYGYAYPKLGSMDSEFGLIFDSLSEKGTEMVDADGDAGPGAPAEVKSDTSSTQIKFVANVMLPIRKNLNYVGGIWYQSNSADDKESKVKNTQSGFGINLATMRVTLD